MSLHPPILYAVRSLSTGAGSFDFCLESSFDSLQLFLTTIRLVHCEEGQPLLLEGAIRRRHLSPSSFGMSAGPHKRYTTSSDQKSWYSALNADRQPVLCLASTREQRVFSSVLQVRTVPVPVDCMFSSCAAGSAGSWKHSQPVNACMIFYTFKFFKKSKLL